MSLNDLSTDWQAHQSHKKRCLKLEWTTNDRKTPKGNIHGAVDLWHCDDCDVDFVHDWTEQ
jgi:hypothetical protein